MASHWSALYLDRERARQARKAPAPPPPPPSPEVVELRGLLETLRRDDARLYGRAKTREALARPRDRAAIGAEHDAAAAVRLAEIADVERRLEAAEGGKGVA